ncbi:Phosphoglucomutase-3 [Agyrium rufum]|nr:Phosphoglucomutase-3 [Agyrium rufum]
MSVASSTGGRLEGRKMELERLAQEWLSLDRNEPTRKEIQDLLDSQDFTELEKRLGTRISFGTAGLRARMEAGFSRMNCLTVIQTSQGLARHLVETADLTNAQEMSIIIGYDIRHNSLTFARLAAAAFAKVGFNVVLFDDPVHTPLVPFAVKLLGAAAGIMVTASHNPAMDNGYKVYGSNSCQINSPADKQIAASILKNLEPQQWELTDSLNAKISAKDEAVKSAYNQEVRRMLEGSISKEPSPIPRFVYTAMHGVGFPFMKEAVAQLITVANQPSFDGFFWVQEQVDPDPDFSTVRFPNPEEHGALDLAMATADKNNVFLILATDPDADRFAAAEKVDGKWHQFTGDQMGVLLAYHILEEVKFSSDTVMLTSAVSSQMLSTIAAKEGFQVEECMTGFKWLGNRARTIGKKCVFAYEEALGYMLPNIVFDKDGITAAMTFLRAAGRWGSPYRKLQDLYEKYGYFRTMNTYWKSADASMTTKLFEKIRERGNPYPTIINGMKVSRWRDLTGDGYDSATDNHVPGLPTSKSTQMITCWLGNDDDDDDVAASGQQVRFTVRASGTEPKIKVYIESRGETAEAAERGALGLLRYLKETWFDEPSLKVEEKYSSF